MASRRCGNTRGVHNDESRDDHDDANPNTGSGASGPGEAGYDGETTVGDEGAADETDGDGARGGDPAIANAEPPRVKDGSITPPG